ncbi:MAG: hypothetical protein A2119_02195 [Candidatus Colwellbacteria bacterium GWA2_46_10]|uniref:BioF2-like acetyltransferase domain-containing protein n=1 Tax=Candidatus Colwellbacteria bacterium GWA2_46_10 TaxID=1797684 RepID=A0A1G1YYD7_9BACT|nr:MAG: hypothetical protein A2119_02195 [Candidatus Colwellbacteria bacterium GWA2_46_10]
MSKVIDKEWEILRSLPSLEVWTKAWENSGIESSFFNHPSWLNHWVKSFNPQLRIWHSLRENVYIPLHIKRSWGLRRLFSVGDVPCLYDEMQWPAINGDTGESFIASLGKEKWDVVQLRFWGNVEQANELVELAKNVGWAVDLTQEEGIPWVNLKEKDTSISRKLAEDVKLNVAKLTKNYGPVTLVKASREDWDEFINAYRDLWRSFGAQPLISRSKSLSDFFKTINEDYVSFYKLNASNETIAWHFGYKFGKEYIYEFPTYNNKYAKYSPGKVLLWFLLEKARKDGYERFSLGRGIEPYKLRWTKKVKPLVSISIYRKKYLSKLDPIRIRKKLVVVYKKLTGRKR